MAETLADQRPVLELHGVSLCYRLARHRVPSFKEYAIHWLRGALRYEQLWALRDVDLVVRPGEMVGIMGRNGAGKSTLLKVMSGVLEPTTGTARRRGSLAPILELGTGFDAELTGWENIFLNALLLGHRRREVEEHVDEIVEFSGLGELIHSPIRNYSTGMLARLGFAVATSWVPQVLLLDEVLAVGDAGFRERCHERLKRFLGGGTAIVLVSHSAEDLRASCERALWLDGGRVAADGPTAEVLQRYADSLHSGAAEARGATFQRAP
jgi:ABC-type polysaccharide/polyol phosphate transport system ATPase subunit